MSDEDPLEDLDGTVDDDLLDQARGDSSDEKYSDPDDSFDADEPDTFDGSDEFTVSDGPDDSEESDGLDGLFDGPSSDDPDDPDATEASGGFIDGVRDGAESVSAPSRPTWLSTGARHRAGARAGAAVSNAISTTILNLLLFVTRLVPFSWRMWRGFLNAGYRGMYKSSKKIDEIGHIVIDGQIKHVPLRYNHERGRYETIEDEPEWWESPAEADNEYRVAGSVPTVWASASTNELGSHVQAEVAEALDLGNDVAVYQDATVQHVTVEDQRAGGSQQAVADGGRGRSEYVHVSNPGSLVDRVVDLSSDGDAKLISLEKYWQTYPSTEDPDKMEQERTIGRLMERDEDLKDYAMKMLLIAVGGIVGVTAILVLGPRLLSGGGGGGGGSIIPFAIDFAKQAALVGFGG